MDNRTQGGSPWRSGRLGLFNARRTVPGLAQGSVEVRPNGRDGETLTRSVASRQVYTKASASCMVPCVGLTIVMIGRRPTALACPGLGTPAGVVTTWVVAVLAPSVAATPSK